MIQPTIATSRLTLPLTAVYAFVVCALYACEDLLTWVGASVLALSTLLMVMLNNANSLIRIYSRLVSCSFLVLMLTDVRMLSSLEDSIIQLCFIASLLILFKAYQDRSATGRIFYSFLFIGIASLLEVKMLCFVPILWILLAFNIMALSIKGICASIAGVLLPYWFCLAYYIYRQVPSLILTHFDGLTAWDIPFSYTDIELSKYIVFAFVVFLGAVGTIHFLLNSQNDKIRTRMFYEIFISLYAFITVSIVLQPSMYDVLIRLLITCVSPLIAHFFALTKTRFTNIAFCITVIVTLAITFANMWIL